MAQRHGHSLSADAAALRVFERKVLRKIFGPVRAVDDFRIRFNSELYELLDDKDVVQRNNIQRLCWLGHVVRIEENAPARRVRSAHRTALYLLERPNRSIIDWCNQLAWARKQQRRLEECVVARRNPLIGLLWPIK